MAYDTKLVYDLCLTIDRHVRKKNIFLLDQEDSEINVIENLAKRMEISYRKKKNIFCFTRKKSYETQLNFFKIEKHFSILLKELYEVDNIILKQLSLRTNNENFINFRKDLREKYNELKSAISTTHLERVESLISSINGESLAAIEVITDYWLYGKKNNKIPSNLKRNKKFLDFMIDFSNTFGISDTLEETYENFYLLTHKKII